jgi:hypothetical protein
MRGAQNCEGPHRELRVVSAPTETPVSVYTPRREGGPVNPISPPEMSLTPKQLETVRAINAANRQFWADDSAQFEQLLQRYPDKRAHLLMEVARAIIKETGASHAAAVRAAEAVELVSRRMYVAGRERKNTRSKALADQDALNSYRTWEKNAAGALKGMDAAKRVANYFKTQSLSRRTKERISDLLARGKI